MGALVVAAAAVALPQQKLAPLDSAVASPLEMSASDRERLLRDPGLALRAARSIEELEEVDAVEWLFAGIESQYPVIGDYAAEIRLQQLAKIPDMKGVEREARAAITAYPSSPMRGRFYEMLGIALEAKGNAEEARAAWRTALDAARSDELRARLVVHRAQSFEAAGQLKEAGDAYAEVWSEYPLSEDAAPSAERLDAIDAASSKAVRTADIWRRRGDRLFRQRRNELALAAYDAALAHEGSDALSDSKTEWVGKQRGHVLFRMREYPKAVEAFSSLKQRDDTPLWRARSLARAGRVSQAVEEFEELARSARGSLGVRSTYLAGLLLWGGENSERSRQHFETVASSRIGTGLENAALWQLGWDAYRRGVHGDAVAYFDQLLERNKDPIGRLRPRYWRARALEQFDAKSAEALTEFEAMAAEYPLSYYGWRSAIRSKQPGEGAPVVASKPPRSGTRALSPAQLERPRILLSAGFSKEAAGELRSLARSARGLEDRLDLAELYRSANEFHAAQRVVVDAYNVVLARGPIANFEELWWHAWPAAFGAMVRASTEERSHVEPGLVYSIMREESGYRAAVVSPSGARGLLQIMQETGQRLAKAVGVSPFSADDLFVPSTNIDLGSYYLHELRERFDGRLAPTIASYNAGPTAVSRWIKEEATLEEDEWVEAIPYDETRGYVKRVLRSMHAYRILY